MVALMGDGGETLDLVVRGGGVALTASSSVLDSRHMLLLGTLLDPELRGSNGTPAAVSTVVNVSLSEDLASGRHVERETTWTLEADDGWQTSVTWVVETLSLLDGYALQDARAHTSELDIRAFGIEDLVATVGVGLAAGVAVVGLWLHHRTTTKMLDEVRRQHRECLEAGGWPTISFGVDDEASFTPEEVAFRIKSGANYKVRCAPREQ